MDADGPEREGMSLRADDGGWRPDGVTLPSFASSGISIAQVQPEAPAGKYSRGAPHLVQADKFYDCDSHGFNNQRSAKRHAGRHLRNFLRNATAKARADSPHLLRCAAALLCLVSGTLSSNRQCSFRHF
jgi:hypothetical protein